LSAGISSSEEGDEHQWVVTPADQEGQVDSISSGLKGRAMIAQGKTATGGRRPGFIMDYSVDSPVGAR
jgi:hypothetical protein